MLLKRAFGGPTGVRDWLAGRRRKPGLYPLSKRKPLHLLVPWLTVGGDWADQGSRFSTFFLLITNHPKISKWFGFFHFYSSADLVINLCLPRMKCTNMFSRHGRIHELRSSAVSQSICAAHEREPPSPCTHLLIHLYIHLFISSFIHDTCIKYLLCPKPSAEH